MSSDFKKHIANETEKTSRGIDILEVKPEQQEDARAFIAKCFSALGWEYGEYDRTDDDKIFAAANNGDGAVLAAFKNREIIGTVAVRKLPDGSAELKRLYVAPKSQNQGLGGMLFEAAYSHALAKGYTTLRADTCKDCLQSRRLLEKYGFEPRGDYNGNPFAELFYEKRIEKPRSE